MREARAMTGNGDNRAVANDILSTTMVAEMVSSFLASTVLKTM
jgi:hypothetical protein